MNRSLFRYCNPIRSEAVGNIRDPQIVNVDGIYYLTGTCCPFQRQTVNPGVKLWSSPDLLNWTYEGLLIDRSTLLEDAWYRDRFWASEIHPKNGKFWLTFNCRNESEKYNRVHSCGLAVADRITGPYTILTHDRPLLDGTGRDTSLVTPADVPASVVSRHPEDIAVWSNDMTLFTDDDGRTYAFFKSHYVQEIDLENARFVGERRRALAADKGTWEDVGIEGMFVIKRGGVYYMLYSSWTRGYEVGYATAGHPTGPWTKYDGNPIYGAQNPELCREKGLEFTGDPESPFIEAGHCEIFTGPDGRDWICAHLRPKGGESDETFLGFDPIWVENGMIKTNGPTYTEQTVHVQPDDGRRRGL